jgi:hypothetical protein
MDVSHVIYGMVAPDLAIAPRPNIHIDEAAELARPLPLPLHKPHPIVRRLASDIEEAQPSTPTDHPAYSAEPEEAAEKARSKHESFNLSGSIFLVTGDGKTLSLPIPSDSKLDPLNFSTWRTIGAMLALGWYSCVTLTAVQAPSVMLNGIVGEFGDEVRRFAYFYPMGYCRMLRISK